MICAVFPLGLLAQQRTEYNRKGDEAMKRLDYSDAKMWYEEGVSQCDAYSIDQLTTIWLSNERMRPSMRSLMNKCLNCLTVKATEMSQEAISKLIFIIRRYGTPKSEELAIYWKEYQEMLLKPAEPEAQPIDSAAVSPKKLNGVFCGILVFDRISLWNHGRRYGATLRLVCPFQDEYVFYELYGRM